MKRRTFIKQLMVGAAIPWLGGNALGATHSKPAKILSCNIRVDLPEDNTAGNGWVHRKAMCAEIIGAQQADLICLQECQQAHLKDLKQSLPQFESFGLANPEPIFHAANAILFSRARYELISAGGFWLSETPHIAGSKSWDSARARFANWVDLKESSSGQSFRLWNAHLDHLGQVAREKQGQLIVEASEALPKTVPQLFAADCNADAKNRAIIQLKAGGWRDTYTEAHGPGDPGFTFHAFLGPKFPDGKAKEKVKGKIDWIFCRGPVKTLGAKIIRDGRQDRFPSDHYFVSAEVTIEG
jgi:endonuclease/exonuclease/phosphatase family metal-dependent hydrolase